MLGRVVAGFQRPVQKPSLLVAEQVIALQEVSGDQLTDLVRALPSDRTVHALRYPRVPRLRHGTSSLEDLSEHLVLVVNGPARQVAAEAFVRVLIEATEIINKDRKRADKDVSDFLKNLDPPLVEQLMTKLRFEMILDDFTLGLFRLAESQLKQQGKLVKPLDYGTFVYPDLMRKVLPAKVNYKP